MFVQYMFIVVTVFPYMVLLYNDVVFDIHYFTSVDLAAKKLLC